MSDDGKKPQYRTPLQEKLLRQWGVTPKEWPITYEGTEAYLNTLRLHRPIAKAKGK